MMRDPVVVTGVGTVSALGWTTESTWAAIVAGRSAARQWNDLGTAGFPIDWACRIADDSPKDEPRGRWLGRLAAAEAVEQSALPERVRAVTGVFLGTTMGESVGFEAAAEGAAFDVEEHAGSAFTDAVAQALQLGGPRRTYGTACAAGNYAIGAAAAALRQGRVLAALAGGVEPFSRIALLGFARMRAMTPDYCRPFDADRRGMQLGEAAAFLVLERLDDALARGAEPLAAIEGFAVSGEAFHPTAPRQDGSGMAAAMAPALTNARLEGQDIGWLCAHGTGTPISDAAEARAIRAVFGEAGPPVSSLKGAVGHTMGAATAVEAAMSVMALRKRVIPGNATTITVDESLGIDVVVAPREAPGLRAVMSCGYAFGGLNSALVIGAGSW